jgi:multisubunit Na+/H+ antiporter MnhB subunit
MTDKNSMIPRIIGAVIAALVYIALMALVLGNLNFSLAVPSSSANLGTMLWDYRVIDVLVQALLLTAAAIGAAALFRLETRNREEEKEE